MASTIPTAQFNLKPGYLHCVPLNTHMDVTSATVVPTKHRGRRRRKPSVSSSFNNILLQLETNHAIFFKPKSVSSCIVFTRVSNDGGGGATSQQKSSDIEKENQSSSVFGDSYVALFVRMLGLDNNPLDREQAIVALWKYSLRGKKCVDNIMQFQGCINLTISLLKSDLDSASEAAAGLLRSISSIDLYRDVVAESGAMEEITSLLSQSSLTSEVKEQSICTLWNLSVDEKHRVKIANIDILPLLIKSLEEDEIKVKEAAGGVLANLALTHTNHNIMVEAGVIPKLATFLKNEVEEQHKVIRKEARNALVELAKNDYYKILIIEEGLVPVPLVGAAAYRSLAPALHSWPSFPDGTEIERTCKIPSRFGASELLLGLNIDGNDASVEGSKMKAIIGRSKQQFLARSGAIEVEDAKSNQNETSTTSAKRRFTLLPWVDGVARLVLILELDDETAISRAAEAIADASINGCMRDSFKEAGAVKHLVRLLSHHSDAVKFSVMVALERLSFSNDICHIIEAERVMPPLSNILKNSQTSDSMMEKALNLLARILDLSREMKLKFSGGAANGSRKGPSAGGVADNSIELTANSNDLRREELDSTVIARLVEMMKHSSPNSQRKAAAVLEFVAISNASMDTILSADISSGLDAIFQQGLIHEKESEIEIQQPELLAVQAEEAGLAVSAASRLLTKLLDMDQFRRTIDSTHFTSVLRKILKSDIPFDYKDWVAACLVKLGSLYGPSQGFENPINVEVTLYETIPRLIEQMRSSFSAEAQEAAVMELNRIISEGVVDATRAVASQGAIHPLIGLLEGGSERAVEAALSILYNLSMDEENHPAILAAGAVPALIRIIRSQRPQWKRALHLLRALPT